jgi:hypothetical protein
MYMMPRLEIPGLRFFWRAVLRTTFLKEKNTFTAADENSQFELYFIKVSTVKYTVSHDRVAVTGMLS